MAHFKIDPITFFLDSTGRFPTKTQQNIINVMDSCQFTLIPFKRLYGITTALNRYVEWEFLHSEYPIEITIGVPNKLAAIDGMFQTIEFCKKARGVFRERYNTLEVESIKSILCPEYMRGALTSDVYIFDVPDRDTEEYLFELIHICRARVGQRRQYAIANNDYQSLSDDTSVQYITKVYNGARFVIVCDNVDDMAARLLHNGVDEDDIGIVDMSAGGFDIESYRRIIPGLIAHDIVGVQPMTVPTGNVFNMKNYSPPLQPFAWNILTGSS